MDESHNNAYTNVKIVMPLRVISLNMQEDVNQSNTNSLNSLNDSLNEDVKIVFLQKNIELQKVEGFELFKNNINNFNILISDDFIKKCTTNHVVVNSTIPVDNNNKPIYNSVIEHINKYYNQESLLKNCVFVVCEMVGESVCVFISAHLSGEKNTENTTNQNIESHTIQLNLLKNLIDDIQKIGKNLVNVIVGLGVNHYINMETQDNLYFYVPTQQQNAQKNIIISTFEILNDERTAYSLGTNDYYIDVTLQMVFNNCTMGKNTLNANDKVDENNNHEKLQNKLRRNIKNAIEIDKVIQKKSNEFNKKILNTFNNNDPNTKK